MFRMVQSGSDYPPESRGERLTGGLSRDPEPHRSIGEPTGRILNQRPETQRALMSCAFTRMRLAPLWHTTLQHVAHAELAAQLTRVYRLALEGEGGVVG